MLLAISNSQHINGVGEFQRGFADQRSRRKLDQKARVDARYEYSYLHCLLGVQQNGLTLSLMQFRHLWPSHASSPRQIRYVVRADIRCVHVDAVRVTMLDNVKNDGLFSSAARKSLHSSSSRYLLTARNLCSYDAFSAPATLLASDRSTNHNPTDT